MITIDKNWLERTELLITPDHTNLLRKANVLVVGLGGVGSFAAEFLCRAGIGNMTIVDGDVVDLTNTNRQLPALHSTVGQSKAQLMAARMLDINPQLQLKVVQSFLEPHDMEALVGSGFDFVLDCIDSFQPKVELIVCCKDLRVPFISSMGAGGRTKPTEVKVRDILKTRDCPLAQQVRKSLKRRNIRSGFKVVSAQGELIRNSKCLTDGSNYKKSFYGTISYMPALFGLHMAAYVIQKLAKLQH